MHKGLQNELKNQEFSNGAGIEDLRVCLFMAHGVHPGIDREGRCPGEQDRPDVARRREQRKKYQTRIAPERLVFIGKTWTKTNMAPLRGWAPRGKRLKTNVPHGHWKTMTFLAALRHDRIEAPWVLDGPINGESFTIYFWN